MDAGSRWLAGVLPWAGLALLGILLIGFSAAAEMAFASVSRAQLRHVLAAQKARAKAAASLIGEPARLLSTLLLTKLVGFVTVTAATILLAQTLGKAVGSAGGCWRQFS